MGLRALDYRRLIICEGAHDAQFFETLCSMHNLEFQVASAGHIAGAKNREGIDSLTRALDALPGIPGFASLDSILIAADNDTEPSETVLKVKELIRATAPFDNAGYAVPDDVLIPSAGQPSITLLMLPWHNVPGSLDTLCMRAAFNKRSALGGHVDAFAVAAGVGAENGWSITKEHKMKLRSFMSAAYRKDPYLSPAWVWQDKTDLVPLSDSVFSEIVSFLKAFA